MSHVQEELFTIAWTRLARCTQPLRLNSSFDNAPSPEKIRKWLNIVLPIITTLIIGVVGYFVSASIKEDIRAIETTIDEMLKPTVYELKEDLKDLTKNFYTNNRSTEVDKNTDSNDISSQK